MTLPSVMKPIYKQLRRDLEEYVNSRLERFETKLKGVVLTELRKIYADIPNKEALTEVVGERVTEQAEKIIKKEFKKLKKSMKYVPSKKAPNYAT